MGLVSSRYFDLVDTNIYKTDGYSGTDADVDDTQRFTDNIDLTIQSGAEIDIKYDGSDSTDDLLLDIYKKLDSSWGGNEHEWKTQITIDSGGTEKVYHYTIPENYEPGHYRFGLTSSGVTTTFEVQVDYRGWRWTKGIA